MAATAAVSPKSLPQSSTGRFEVKTVLPQSEHDDSRPILFKRCGELPGLVSVMGGKIDNVYDLPRELDGLFQEAA